MRSGWLHRHRVPIASGAVVLAAAGSLVAYALAAHGYAVHHADLNDGGVWVTRGQGGQIGRVNKPINQLDGYVYAKTGSSDLDVFQDGDAVLADDATAGEIYPVDGSAMRAVSANSVNVPADEIVTMAGGVLAILDPDKGAVHAMTYDPEQELSGVDALETRPMATMGSGAALTVAQDGTIYAASAGRGLVTIRRTVTGFAKPVHSSLGALSGSLQITAVGDLPVVLATEQGAQSSTAVLPDGRRVQVPVGTGAALQQAGPSTADVLVADTRSLYSVPLSDGLPTRVFSQGTGQSPAAPVQLGGCRFAAWSGPTVEYATACSSASLTGTPIPDPDGHGPVAFRVNRQQLLLNDTQNGNAWNVDSRRPQLATDWQQVTAPDHQKPPKSTSPPNPGDHASRAPKAHDHAFGARPGHTTALYVLDFDSDPSGGVMSVDSVQATVPSQRSWYSIAPDGQTVDVAVPAGTTTSSTFSYVLRSSNGREDTATINVGMRTPAQNAAPTTRYGWSPAKAVRQSVPEGGTVTIPVLQDWRDYKDGDVVTVASASVKGGSAAGRVAVSPDGQLIYTAPAVGGDQTIDYVVTDGRSTASGHVQVHVQRPGDPAAPAIAAPDYARAQVDKPVTVYPLANDLPGSDPLDPGATLRLAADVKSGPSATVNTDPASGAVTITPHTVRPLTLDYQVAFGSARFSTSTITVRVDPPAADAGPVAAPDTAVLHGQRPVTVDVLANDSDPAGNVLVVQSAVPAEPDQLRVAVLNGRFLEIVPTQRSLSPTVQSLTYTVTDGVSQPVKGSVTVTQLPDPRNDTPITLTDYATVRSGDSTVIPVLDNDTTPAGDPVSLVQDVPDGPTAPGRLRVSPNLGAAYVSGKVVRYVAPKHVSHPTPVTITYQAQSSDGGATQDGTAVVTVTPPIAKDNPNRSPVPLEVDVRSVAGDQVRIKVPTTGIDPDGDSTVVTGIGSAPRLGRVVGFDATSITYESFPNADNGGTDSFQYTVTDLHGATGTGTIRVAIVPPAQPQPPIAIDDTLTVAPGAVVTADVLANDYVATGDQVKIDDVHAEPATADAKLAGPQGPVTVRADTDVKRSVTVRYTISDGLNSSSADLTVNDQKDANLPPIAFDQYPTTKPNAKSVSVDLLQHDYDPDSRSAPVVVSPVAAARTGRLVVSVKTYPQAIPYVIRDGAGGTASAVVYVPASTDGAPYAKPGKHIHVPVNKTVTARLAGYVVNPADKPVHVTTPQTLSWSPARDLTVKITGNGTALRLTAQAGYAGPAAVTVEVTDGARVSSPGAHHAYVTIPVDIGRAPPVLRCPTTPFEVKEGAPPVSIDIASVCHVWTPDRASAASLTFSGKYRGTPDVHVSGNRTGTLLVGAVPGALPGKRGTITVTVDGAAALSQKLHVIVGKSPPPTIDPIVLRSLPAGQPMTFDIAPYVHSAIHGPISIVGQPKRLSPMAAQMTAQGSKITERPGPDSYGQITFSVTVTDEPRNEPLRSDHEVTGQITLIVLGHPATPTGLAAGTAVLSNEVKLSWDPVDDHGSPITHYVVRYAGATPRTCPGAAPSCDIHDPATLHNGQKYTFQVQAWNAVGHSGWSGSTSATPNARPSAIGTITAAGFKNAALTLTWTKPTGDFSPVTGYRLTWDNGGQATVNTTARTVHYPVSGLDNDHLYTFHVRPVNDRGIGPEQTATAQSAWKPAEVSVRPITAEQTASAAGTTFADIVWAKTDPNGPAVVHYRVYRATGSSTPGTNAGTQISNDADLDGSARSYRDDNITNDGTKYWYSVAAVNGHGYVSDRTTWQPFLALGKPGPVEDVSATDHHGNQGISQAVEVTFKLGAPNGAEITHVDYSLGGGPSGSWTINAKSGTFTEDIPNLTNGDPYSGVTLTEYNSDAEGTTKNSLASDPVTWQGDLSPYGPPQDLQVTATGVGSHVNWTVSVDPNGRATTVHVTDNNTGLDQTYTTGNKGPWSMQGSQHPGFNSSDKISATAQNISSTTPASGDSGSQNTSSPSVSVSPSAAKETNSYCTSQYCRAIIVAGSGFDPNTTYDVLYTTTCTNCAGTGGSCPDYTVTTTSYYYACEQVTSNGNGDVDTSDRLFGYNGKTVIVDVGNPKIAGGSSSNWP